MSEELKAKLNEAVAEIERLRNHKSTLEADLKKIRDERNELRDKQKQFEKQLEELKLKSEHGDDILEKANEIAASKIERLQSEFEEKLAELAEQATEYRQKFEETNKKFSQEKVHLAIRQAAEKANVVPSAIDDIVARGERLFTLTEDGKIEARDEDGGLLKFGKKVVTPEVFVEKLREEAPHFWPASQSSGASGTQNVSGYTGKNPFAKESYNLTEQLKLKKENPELAARLQEAAA